MFTLRRAAARAVFAQPIRQLSTLRPASRVSPFQIEKPVLSRSLHQSWKLLAEETKSSTEEAEATGENASETVQEKAEETAQEAKSTISNVVEQAQNAASSAAETVQDAMSSVMTPGSQDGAGSAATHNNKILYIGNLFFEVTPAQLEAEFSQFGRITNTTIVSDNRGMSKGFAYIEFADTSSAERAVREKSQVVFQGRRMAVQFHVPRQARTNQKNESANPPSKTLFIGNMSYQMTDGDLNGKWPFVHRQPFRY